MKNKSLSLMTALAASIGIAPVADAALLRFIWSGGGAGDGVTFADAGNWLPIEGSDGSNLPGDVVDGGAVDATNVILQAGGTSTTSVNAAFTPANPFDILIVRFGHTLGIASNFELTGIPTLLGQAGTGSTINHTAGTFTTSTLTVGGGADGLYSLSGIGVLNAASILVNSNSTFTLADTASVSTANLNIDSGSMVNLNGGSFTLTQTSGPNNGTAGVGPTVNGTLSISGGTHVFNERLHGSGTVQIVGSDANISFHQIGVSPAFDFVFDANGASMVTGAGGFPWFNLSTGSLSVDGSAYTGGKGIITLFDSTDAAGSFFNPANVSVTGLGIEGVNWQLNQVAIGGRNLVQMQVLPEPSSLALLGLGGVAMLLRRRK